MGDSVTQEIVGDVWRYFWPSRQQRRYWHIIGRSRDVAKHCPSTEQSHPANNYLCQNISSDEVENPGLVREI